MSVVDRYQEKSGLNNSSLLFLAKEFSAAQFVKISFFSIIFSYCSEKRIKISKTRTWATELYGK